MYKKLTLASVIVAAVVAMVAVMLRISGTVSICPDWPTCFGQLLPLDMAQFEQLLTEKFPGSAPSFLHVVEVLGFRFLQALLALLVFSTLLVGWWQKALTSGSVIIGILAVGCLGADIYLGHLLINELQLPVLNAAFELFAMMAFWLLFYLNLQSQPTIAREDKSSIALPLFTLFVWYVQIKTGVWVSVTGAESSCNGFPLCNNQLWPEADYASVLNPYYWLSEGIYKPLTLEQQTAIAWLHRLLAIFCSVMVLVQAILGLRSAIKPLRQAGLWLLLFLGLSLASGIAHVFYSSLFILAVAHNVLASLTLLPLLNTVFYLRNQELPASWLGIAEQLLDSADVEEPLEETLLAPEPEPALSSESLFKRLKSQLQKTRSGLGNVLANLTARKDENELLDELEANLIMADLGIQVATDIIQRLKQNLTKEQLTDAEQLKHTLKQELLSILIPCSQPLVIPKSDKPFVILVVGVNGVGKTTTIGKLAKRLQNQGHSVMLAAGDTFRAAAVEQLQTWGERNNVLVVAQQTGADSASVIFDGLQSAQAKGVDVLIADTAGRLHTKSNLMDELKKVKRIMNKLDETAPHEVLLVLDAGTGQNALSQAKIFNEAIGLTGLALTKLDGTAKGGVIFALAGQTGIPIRFIGIGEGIDDLQDFNAEAFVDALFEQ